MSNPAGQPDLETQTETPPHLAGSKNPGRMAVVVVNYNTLDYLRACLNSVIANEPSELVVVDNASSDGSTEMVRSEFPTIDLQVNDRNAGYGAAANQGISRCLSEYVLLLNSDTLVPLGALGRLAGVMDENLQAGVVGPRLEYPDGRHQVSSFHFPTPLHTFLKSTSIGNLVGKIPFLREHYLPSWSHNRARPVPWVLGAALGIRKEAFDQVGCFDESFFMFSEEVDLCYRLWSSGWEVHFSPEVTVVHSEGASMKGCFAEMELLRYASTQQFYRHHYSNWRLLLLRMLTTYFMLRNILFVYARLAFKGQAQGGAKKSESLSLWKKVLHNSWAEQQKP